MADRTRARKDLSINGDLSRLRLLLPGQNDGNLSDEKYPDQWQRWGLGCDNNYQVAVNLVKASFMNLKNKLDKPYKRLQSQTQ